MARYADEFLERIKRTADLPALARAKGAQLIKCGEKWKCLCIFHHETEASLYFFEIDGMWFYKCYGCERTGDVIKFVMETDGISFLRAVEFLANECGLRTAGPDPEVKQSKVSHHHSPVVLSAEDHRLCRQVFSYYNQRLKQSPVALDYLKGRKVGSEEAINHHLLGFCDGSLGGLIPTRNYPSGAEIRDRLKKLGIYRQNGREHFHGYLVVPIMDENGIITEAYGRKIGRLHGRPKHLYLPGPHKGIWNLQALNSEELILCESIVDALSFWNQGLRSVTSIYGTSGMNEEIFEAIVRSPVKALKFAYDHDGPGDKNIPEHAERFMNEGIDCFRIIFPRGMDANDYVQRVEDPHHSLRQLVESAIWLGNGKSSTTQGDQSPEKTNEKQGPVDGTASEQVRPGTDTGPEKQDKVPVEALISNGKVEIDFDDRHYRIYGLFKNMSYGVLKINLRVMKDELYYDDEINLLKARSRNGFIATAAREVGLSQDDLKREIGLIVLKMEELQDEQIKKAMEPTQKVVVLSDAEREEALALLKSRPLLKRIVSDYGRCGLVREQVNIAVLFLACVSRLLAKPLGIIIQSVSAAGKSYLIETALSFIAKELVLQYSAMTGQSLFYMGETKLKHKILVIEEQEGADRVIYPLKLLLSEGKLMINSTGKNPTTGRHEAYEHKVEGPTAPLSSTTLDIDEELQNRIIALTPDESREQTRAIHHMQRWLRTLEGHLARAEWEHIRKVHCNAQRLLRPLEVVNPYACHLTFVDDKTRTRRDQLKYLTLIDAMTLLHQYQRPIKSFIRHGKEIQYVETILEDIEEINGIANEVLGRSLDELPPHTRRFVTLLDEIVVSECKKRGLDRNEYRFTRREVADLMNVSYDQVRVHLQRLVDLEYVLVHRGSRGQQFVYELLYDGRGKDGKPFMIGLIDVDALKNKKI